MQINDERRVTMTIASSIESILDLTWGEWANNMSEISTIFFHKDNNVIEWMVEEDTLSMLVRCFYSEVPCIMLSETGELGDGLKSEEEIQEELKPLLEGKDSPLAKYMTTHLNHSSDDQMKLRCVSCEVKKWEYFSCMFDDATTRISYLEPEVVLKFKEA